MTRGKAPRTGEADSGSWGAMAALKRNYCRNQAREGSPKLTGKALEAACGQARGLKLHRKPSWEPPQSFTGNTAGKFLLLLAGAGAKKPFWKTAELSSS